MADPYVREIGRVRDLDDCTVIVGVDYGSVYLITAGVRRLTQAQAREFAQLFVAAVWQAGAQQGRMGEEDAMNAAEETYEADGGDTMHDGCPIEAVFPDDRFPCTFERGHDGPHSFIGLHVSP